MRSGLYNKVPRCGARLLKMSIAFNQARFLISAAKLSQCPADTGAEVAFCGRSNAGKSSAINALCRQKNLARTSKTPGRTQLLNFFALDDHRTLVDLPGYGYAKVPMAVKDHWHKHLDEYLRHRESLRGMILLMDIRHPLKEFDVMMLEWCTEAALPLHILLTKADKLKKGPQKSSVLAVRRAVPDSVTAQAFSAPKKLGLDELGAKIQEWLQVTGEG